MPDSNQPKNESTAIVKNTDTDISLNWGPDNQFHGRIATMLVQDRCVPSDIRMGKVLAIRRQIADGVYSIDKRLEAVLDRLLEDINI